MVPTPTARPPPLQSEAAEYLRQWLQRHPKYGPAALAHPPPPDSSQLLSNTVGVGGARADIR